MANAWALLTVIILTLLAVGFGLTAVSFSSLLSMFAQDGRLVIEGTLLCCALFVYLQARRLNKSTAKMLAVEQE